MPIVVNQGRTLYRAVKITANGSPYLLKTNEKIRFGVKRSRIASQYLILKKMTKDDEINGEYPFELTPTDTNLPTGYYIYDVSVQLADGSCHSVQSADDFVVKESVTFEGDE